MANANLKGSFVLSQLNREIDGIRQDMQENLNMLNCAFAVACESWKDVNAQTCKEAFTEHSAEMRSHLKKLEDIENSLSKLFSFAEQYEDI